jgi:hypothetical protein
MKYIFLIFSSVVINSFLNSLHYTLWNRTYEQCKQELIAEKNYNTQQQAFDCVNSKMSIKILGTILFSDGSIL